MICVEETNYVACYRAVVDNAKKTSNLSTIRLNEITMNPEEKSVFNKWKTGQVPDIKFYNSIIKIIYALILSSTLMMSIYGALYAGARGYIKVRGLILITFLCLKAYIYKVIL